MANWYVSSVAYTAVAQFAISHTYVIGNIIRQLAAPAVGSERCFRCTTGGVSGGSESAWTLTHGSTTTQGTAVFTEITGQEAFQAAGAWAAPAARIGNAGASGWAVAGDNIYVAANHAETAGASITWSIQGTTLGTAQTSIICVDSTGTGHVPPQSGDIRTTATFTISGNFAFTLNGGDLYCYGVTFNLQSGGNNNQSNLIGSSTRSLQKFDTCAFNCMSTSNSNLTLNITTGGSMEWVNTPVNFGNAGVTFSVGGKFVWRNTPSAFSGSTPTTAMLIDQAMANVYFDGLDLSGIGAARVAAFSAGGSRLLGVNCKLAANAVAVTPNSVINDDIRIDYLNCDSGGTTVTSTSYSSEMTLTTSTAIVRTGGASDGTTAYSWACAPGTSAKWSQPGQAWPVVRWNSLTGSPRTVSLEAVVNAAAVLTTAQLWIDVDYLGTGGSTLASLASSGTANVLASGSNIAASSQAWDSAATARQSSHAYVVGDIIAASSNAGRIFFCTTSGTSASGLPIAYQSAADGDSVTDGTAVFRAGCRMTLSVSLTPQVAGLLRAAPKVAVASTTVYLDPYLTVA